MPPLSFRSKQFRELKLATIVLLGRNESKSSSQDSTPCLYIPEKEHNNSIAVPAKAVTSHSIHLCHPRMAIVVLAMASFHLRGTMPAGTGILNGTQPSNRKLHFRMPSLFQIRRNTCDGGLKPLVLHTLVEPCLYLICGLTGPMLVSSLDRKGRSKLHCQSESNQHIYLSYCAESLCAHHICVQGPSK